MKLPCLLAVDASKFDEVSLDIDVLAELEAFRGHFPGHPILPGVVQVDWALRFANLHLAVEDAVAKDFQVKFRNVIFPGKPLTLILQFDKAKRKLSFEYKSGENIMSSGQIRLSVPK